MKSVILCEGYSDFILLQYYMRTVNAWEYNSDNKNEKIKLDGKNINICHLIKSISKLDIIGCGGCSRIPSGLKYLLDYNINASIEEQYNKIVIITDRDEVGTEEDFIGSIYDKINDCGIELDENLINNTWSNVNYNNGFQDKCELQMLILVIPFEDTGAMETFLLNAIAGEDEYDADIINKSNIFVENIDPERRYLNKRGYITKAKFDVYFSVRTASKQFVERQNILKSVPWEKYKLIQRSFEKLGNL